MAMELEGQVAVVTGGGAGIGAAIARLFAQHGAKVEIAEIVAESGGTIADEIRAAGGACRAHAIDERERRVVPARERVSVHERRVRVAVGRPPAARQLVEEAPQIAELGAIEVHLHAHTCKWP